MSCLSTTWFRFLLKLGSFFGKHLNEAQKGVSELECYNATVFVRNNEDARVGTCESTCLSQETPWRGGDGHVWEKSEQRDEQAKRELHVWEQLSKKKVKFPNSCPVVCL